MVELKRVLCPVDLTELSIRPLAYAGAIARWYGGALTALHVVPSFEPIELRAGALFDPVQLVQPMPRDEVLDRIRQALDAAGAPADATPVAEAGEPVQTIVDQSVVTRSDIVVMGTHGRSGFDRFLLGSVAEKVLRRAPCPVLTVPPHAAGSPSGVTLRTVLCPMDFSPAALQAFGFALDLARRADAAIVLLHAIEWLAEDEPRGLQHFNVPEYRRHLIRDAHERLDALLAQEAPVARGTRTLVVVGRAHRQILQAAAEERADLIAMGAQGHGGPGLAPLGSTTQQVVREAPCPVLTVRAPVLGG